MNSLVADVIRRRRRLGLTYAFVFQRLLEATSHGDTLHMVRLLANLKQYGLVHTTGTWRQWIYG